MLVRLTRELVSRRINMGDDRYWAIAAIIVDEWLQTTDPTRDVRSIHLTNRSKLEELIVDELKKEHDDTKKTSSKKTCD
jgi:hypothetical protein